MEAPKHPQVCPHSICTCTLLTLFFISFFLSFVLFCFVSFFFFLFLFYRSCGEPNVQPPILNGMVHGLELGLQCWRLLPLQRSFRLLCLAVCGHRDVSKLHLYVPLLFSFHFSSSFSFFLINLYFVASGTAQGIFSVNLQTGSGGDKGSTYLYFMDANKNVRTCFLSFSSCFTIIFCSFFRSPLSYNSVQSIMSYSKLNQVSVGSYAPQIIQAVIPSNARYAYIQMTCNKLSISSACVSYWTSASLTGM